MPEVPVWPTIHVERKALATDLHSVDDRGWETPSLCTHWSARDVLAHMTATARITPPAFFTKIVGSGFSFAKLQAKDIARERGSTPADTLANFESIETSTKHPPGPLDTMLGETLVHAEDIRRPLGIRHNYPIAAIVQAADFFKGSNLIIGTKRRIAGLRLTATDTDWSTGSGPEVHGPMMALLMAMTGRKPALDDLTGDGVAILRERP